MAYPPPHPGRDVRMGQIADWMAENGGSLSEAARALGWPYGNAKKVWQRVRRRLGDQAV